MTEITYTNKDGLTPAEGTKSLDWTNRNGVSDSPFNYHQDGAAEGHGYAHGGYPEVTGESSPYTDTSYKTGDDPDFFDNGNVYEEPSVGPGPEPTPSYVTLLRFGSFSQVAKDGVENPYGEHLPEDEEDYHYFNGPSEYGTDLDITQTIEDENIGEDWAPGDYNGIWKDACEIGWYGTDEDLSGIISNQSDLLNLKIRLTCNGTQHVLPIQKEEGEFDGYYYAGQERISGSDYPPTEGAIVDWTYPFHIAFWDWASQSSLRCTIGINIRVSEDVVLENVEIVTEQSESDSTDEDEGGKSLTISGTFVNDNTVKGPAVSDEDFAILVDNNGKIANVNYNGTTHQAMVSYNENDGGGIDLYFASDDNLGTSLWIYAEDGSEDTTRYLQAAKENGTVGEEEFTISIDLENFTEDAGGGGGDIGR